MVKLVKCSSKSFRLAPDNKIMKTLSKDVEMTNEILVSISGLIGVKVKEQGIILAIILSSILIISQLTTQAYARNITTFIHFNEEAIENGVYSGDIWYTVDGKNYSNSNYDMSDAIYGSDPEIEDDLFTDGYSDELMVADNASKICFEERYTEDPDYKACSWIDESTTEVHFTFPASWPSED
jgi:hypothetical protein